MPRSFAPPKPLRAGHVDLFGLETCDGERDTISILACAHDIAGRVMILRFKAQAFVHQIEKAVETNARPPEGI